MFRVGRILVLQSIILLVGLLISAATLYGQVTFKGFDVTDYKQAKGEHFSHYEKDIYLRTEGTGDFDAILINTKRKRFVFADQNGEDTTFKESYQKLVDRYGKEDKNMDSLPAAYQPGNYRQLKLLVRSKQARIHRIWNYPEDTIGQIMLIWDEGGLTLVFDANN